MAKHCQEAKTSPHSETITKVELHGRTFKRTIKRKIPAPQSFDIIFVCMLLATLGRFDH